MQSLLPRIPTPLGWLLILIGVSAFAGGIGLVSAPDGSNMGYDTTWLEGSPFNDFLVPGLILLVAVGGINFLAGIAVLRRWRFAAEAAFSGGAIVVGWITIQVFIINQVSFLHIIYWTVGAVVMLAAIAARRDDRLRHTG